MSSTELTTEAVELGEGMLGLIGAYGMHAVLDVRDLQPKTTSKSSPRKRGPASTDTDTGEDVRQSATA
jgi:hypothetical protein